jgi:hypothetical protein
MILIALALQATTGRCQKNKSPKSKVRLGLF